MTTIIAVLIVIAVAFRLTTPQDRARFVGNLVPWFHRAVQAAAYGRRECAPFREALRARTPWAVVTPILAAGNLAIFVWILFGAADRSAPDTLIGWGAIFGPRTTNGEWWRLVAAMFVHATMLHVVANTAGLMQAGLILERLVGSVGFAGVYVAAGVLSGLVNLSKDPMGVSVGASGAVFGIYGLLLATWIQGQFHRSPVTIPPIALQRLLPSAAVFLVYSLVSGRLAGGAEIVGLATGFVGGVALTRGLSDSKPSGRRIAFAMGATLVIAIGSAVPLRGVADVRPEIARIVALEDRLSGDYLASVDRFTKRKIGVEVLVEQIERTILPALQAATAQLNAIEGVPGQHEHLVAGAREYLRLRDESWRLRADGLRSTNMLKLQHAERAARIAIEALEPLRPPVQP